jgi:hypothetical protein
VVKEAVNGPITSVVKEFARVDILEFANTEKCIEDAFV